MKEVSIHAPWEGCDDADCKNPEVLKKFQFTHPGKGATTHPPLNTLRGVVSIHAPWEGCDGVA